MVEERRWWYGHNEALTHDLDLHVVSCVDIANSKYHQLIAAVADLKSMEVMKMMKLELRSDELTYYALDVRSNLKAWIPPDTKVAS